MIPGARDVRIEVRGLTARGPHGVTEAEREVGCRIVVDVAFTVAASPAVTTDELSDTVDYAAVAEVVARTVRERSCRTLERLAALVAAELGDAFEVRDLTVRVAKPEPPMPEAVAEVAVVLGGGEDT